MLMPYIQAALRHASYEILSDDGSSTGKSPSVMGYMPTPQPWKNAAHNWRRC